MVLTVLVKKASHAAGLFPLYMTYAEPGGKGSGVVAATGQTVTVCGHKNVCLLDVTYAGPTATRDRQNGIRAGYVVIDA